MSEGRPSGQKMRPVRQDLQRPPRCRRRILVEAEKLLDPKAGAPVHHGGYLPDWRRLLESPGVHAGLWSCFLFILTVWKHNSLLPCHDDEIPLFVPHLLQKPGVPGELSRVMLCFIPLLCFLSHRQQASANQKRGKNRSFHQAERAALKPIMQRQSEKDVEILIYRFVKTGEVGLMLSLLSYGL